MSPAVFTDLATDTISVALAAREPERGAALVAAGGIVHRVVEDVDGEYTGVSWTISAALTRRVQEVEGAGAGTLAGTVHTHPAGTPDPSAADLRATVRLLDANPHMETALVAIVTEGRPRVTDLAIGTTHRMSLHLARRQPHGTHRFTRVGGRTIPLCRDLEGADATVAPPSVWFEHQTALGDRLALPVRAGSGGEALLLTVPCEYPYAAPALSRLSTDPARGTRALPWSVDRPAAPQLRRMLADSSAAPISGSQARTRDLTGRLSDRRVVVVGVGSVGSTLATELVRAGVGALDIVDPDSVSPANLSRSVYTAPDVGVAKVEALADRLRAISPSVRVRGWECELLDVEDLPALVTGADLVVATTDDPVGQAVLSHHTYATGAPMVAVGLYAAAAAGEVVISHPAVGSPCWSCAVGGARGLDRLPAKDYGTGRLVGELALGPPIRLVTEVGAQLAIGLLAGPARPAGRPVAELLASGRTLGLISTSSQWGFFSDLFGSVPGAHAGPQSVWPQVTADPECPVCGPDRRPPSRRRTSIASRLGSLARRLTSNVDAAQPVTSASTTVALEPYRPRPLRVPPPRRTSVPGEDHDRRE